MAERSRNRGDHQSAAETIPIRVEAQALAGPQLVPSLTDDGQNLLKVVEPDMLKAQQRILKPLPAAERGEFMRMLRKLVAANNELSRAPSEA